MPRAEHSRQDLHRGLRMLHRYWRLGLDAKTRYARRLIEMALTRHERPVVCWSGGKDSTVLLHLVLEYKADIPVIYNDTGVQFPETREFVARIANQWKLNLWTARPAKGESFWRVVATYGWPIFGKAQALSAERAQRSGNLRSKLSPLERALAAAKIRVSSRCCDVLQERPTKTLELHLGADVKLLGLLAAESRSRTRLWVDHGAHYFVKRYFGRGRNIWKVCPLSIWTDDDIWEYHRRHGLPHCRLYDMGHIRNGCWPCAMGIRHGQLARLRQSHPHLFLYLMTKTDLGKELLKAKLAIDAQDAPSHDSVSRSYVASLLEVRPCFFDRL